MAETRSLADAKALQLVENTENPWFGLEFADRLGAVQTQGCSGDKDDGIAGIPTSTPTTTK